MDNTMDLNLLKALSTRDRYKTLNKIVPREMFDALTGQMLDWYGAYFNKYPEHEKVQWDALTTLMRLAGTETPESITIINRLIEQLRAPADDVVVSNVLQQLEEQRFAGKVGALLQSYQNGDEIDLTFEVQELAVKARSSIKAGASSAWEARDILQCLEADADDAGIKFTAIPALAEGLKSLRVGHNIALAAPTDAGKSSLLLRIAVESAKQAKVLYPGQPLLYLINEGTAEILEPRLYQTALGLQRSEMLDQARAGTLVQNYIDVVGSHSAIRLIDIHGQNTAQVARLIEAHNPYMVITDMTGRIATTRQASSEVIQVEQVWNTMREYAAMYKFIHLGTVQVSGEGFDNLHPPISALQMSKVGIQTTLDLLLIMGMLFDEKMENVRGFDTPKNKLRREGAPKRNKMTGIFDAELNAWRDYVRI